MQDVSKDSVSTNEQSAYWYQRYSLRPLLDPQGHVILTSTGAAVHDVPAILEDAKDSILTTGKYLNAIRECGREVERPLPPDVHIGANVSCPLHRVAFAAVYLLQCTSSSLGSPFLQQLI